MKYLSKKLFCVFSVVIAVVFISLAYFIFSIPYANAEENTPMYEGLKQIAPYTHEITFNDYTYDNDLQTISTDMVFGCSSVKNGRYYGRNFDFIFNDTPEFVVRMKANENRYSSIGMAQHWGLREDDLNAGKYDKQLELIPNLTLDGINEKGVVANINVVPRYDVAEVVGTNPKGEKLHMLHMVRYILDNAGSAQDAVKLLKNRNIYGNMGDKNLHLMVADRNKTFIVEFIDNQLVAVEKTGNEQIMTNFYNNLDEVTEHGMGVERYNILKENYSMADSQEGMTELLKKVAFMHIPELNVDNAWASDTGFSATEVKENTYEEKLAWTEAYGQKYKSIAHNEEMRSLADPGVWITVHNTTYDIDTLTLVFNVQEDYDHSLYYVVSDELGHRPSPFGLWTIVGIIGGLIVVTIFIYGFIIRTKRKNKKK